MDTIKQTKEEHLKLCYSLYEEYKWLIDGYVLNFYTENNWDKLSPTWQKDLQDVTPETLAQILDYKSPLNIRATLPLSLLALRKLVSLLDVPRQNIPHRNIDIAPQYLNVLQRNVNVRSKRKGEGKQVFSDRAEKLLWKHVKQKKRHEIIRMAEIAHRTAQKTKCFDVVDVGSGVGHLCRVLSYGYGLKMCGVEAQSTLSQTAKELDGQFQSFVKKYPRGDGSGLNPSCKTHPVHINARIDFDIVGEDFLHIVKTAFDTTSVNVNTANVNNVNANTVNVNSDINHNPHPNFGIVALHACGDLTATLLRLYHTCDNIKFLNIVGCCYMKLSDGYPLSDFSKSHRHTLSYHSREVACHAIESYVERLNGGRYWELKIHAYRAALEKILREHWPEHCESPLANVKYTEDLSFFDYCKKAVRKLDLFVPEDVTDREDIVHDLEGWNKVVIFYSLRLLLAPIVETIILLDRFLYVLENVGPCELIPAFDPKLSPRNHIFSSCKGDA